MGKRKRAHSVSMEGNGPPSKKQKTGTQRAHNKPQKKMSKKSKRMLARRLIQAGELSFGDELDHKIKFAVPGGAEFDDAIISDYVQNTETQSEDVLTAYELQNFLDSFKKENSQKNESDDDEEKGVGEKIAEKKRQSLRDRLERKISKERKEYFTTKAFVYSGNLNPPEKSDGEIQENISAEKTSEKNASKSVRENNAEFANVKEVIVVDDDVEVSEEVSQEKISEEISRKIDGKNTVILDDEDYEADKSEVEIIEEKSTPKTQIKSKGKNSQRSSSTSSKKKEIQKSSDEEESDDVHEVFVQKSMPNLAKNKKMKKQEKKRLQKEKKLYRSFGLEYEPQKNSRKLEKSRSKGKESRKEAEAIVSVVGHGIPPISSENLGHKMLKKMGWSGGGLGAKGEGQTEPMPVFVRRKFAGLN